LLGLSNLFKKSQPLPAGILSGLGEGLAQDDYHDREEWFTFKRKEKSPELSNTATKPTQTKVSDTEHHLHQEINTQRILTALKEHRTDKKQITEQILTKIYESLKITRMSET